MPPPQCIQIMLTAALPALRSLGPTVPGVVAGGQEGVMCPFWG